jgi:hypothetical protein
MFAELLQRCLDAEFDELYDECGSFTRKRVKGRMYWYHQRKIGGKVVASYVGPVTDKSITDRVKRFAEIDDAQVFVASSAGARSGWGRFGSRIPPVPSNTYFGKLRPR